MCIKHHQLIMDYVFEVISEINMIKVNYDLQISVIIILLSVQYLK